MAEMDANTRKLIDKFRQDKQALKDLYGAGKLDSEYAWLMDELEEEYRGKIPQEILDEP